MKTKSFLDGRNKSEMRDSSKTPTDNKSGLKEVIIEEVANSGAENDSPEIKRNIKSPESSEKEIKPTSTEKPNAKLADSIKQTKTADNFNKNEKSKGNTAETRQ